MKNGSRTRQRTFFVDDETTNRGGDTMEIIKTRTDAYGHEYAVVEFSRLPDDDVLVYSVVEVDRVNGQVKSCLCGDMESQGGTWYAAMSDSGCRYVTHGRSRAAAMQALRRLDIEDDNADALNGRR